MNITYSAIEQNSRGEKYKAKDSGRFRKEKWHSTQIHFHSSKMAGNLTFIISYFMDCVNWIWENEVTEVFAKEDTTQVKSDTLKFIIETEWQQHIMQMKNSIEEKKYGTRLRSKSIMWRNRAKLRNSTKEKRTDMLMLMHMKITVILWL